MQWQGSKPIFFEAWPIKSDVSSPDRLVHELMQMFPRTVLHIAPCCCYELASRCVQYFSLVLLRRSSYERTLLEHIYSILFLHSKFHIINDIETKSSPERLIHIVYTNAFNLNPTSFGWKFYNFVSLLLTSGSVRTVVLVRQVHTFILCCRSCS